MNKENFRNYDVLCELMKEKLQNHVKIFRLTGMPANIVASIMLEQAIYYYKKSQIELTPGIKDENEQILKIAKSFLSKFDETHNNFKAIK